MTTDTTNHHPDPAIHDHDRDDPGLRYPYPNWKLGAWTDYPPCQRCGHYHQSTPDRCVGAVGLADEAETVTRPDVVVTPGSGTAVLSGDRALDLIDVVGCIRAASHAAEPPPLPAAHRRCCGEIVKHCGGVRRTTGPMVSAGRVRPGTPGRNPLHESIYPREED